MNNIVLFEPGIGTLNKGDEIITIASEQALSDICTNQFVAKFGTHAPVVSIFQNNSHYKYMDFFNTAKYKFICGSNLLWVNMLSSSPSLNVNLMNYKPYENSILLGVGLGRNKSKLNHYTRSLYKKILSDKYIHSVRDEASKRFIESLGLKAINTGCPTTWILTDEFCATIPTKKSSNVVFTLTDYCKDQKSDKKLIDILLNNYENVYYWVQGAHDLDYLNQLHKQKNINIIPPSVEAYDIYLKNTQTDYVGTRLHAGIFALQHKRRSIIISVDNRVEQIKETYNFKTITRLEIEKLDSIINSDFNTEIHIKKKNIEEWKMQFNNL